MTSVNRLMKDAVARANGVKPQVFALVTAGNKGFDCWSNSADPAQTAGILVSNTVAIIQNQVKPEKQNEVIDSLIKVLEKAKEAIENKPVS